MKKTLCLLLCFVGFGTQLVFGEKDKAGSKDHPLINRYQGSHIVNYHYVDFDRYDLATNVKPPEQPTPIKSIEGEVTTITYQVSDTAQSLLKVYRNFEQALKQAGFKELFACDMSNCGRGFPKDLYGNDRVSGKYFEIDPWNMGNTIHYHYWNGVLNKDGKNVYLALVVNKVKFDGFPVKINLDIVEVSEMEIGLVTLNPEYLKNQLVDQGRVVLSGIEFDTNKDTLKSTSSEALKAIADYLKANPKANVYIVGHTDNQGDYQSNKALSERRASRVVNTLTSQFKIAANRLSAIGVADVAPVTNNSQEATRAKNRRVEMVLR